jgi:hypothetical protein
MAGQLPLPWWGWTLGDGENWTAATAAAAPAQQLSESKRGSSQR